MDKDRIWVRDRDWILLGSDTKAKCRRILGQPRRMCPNTAIAQLRRSNGWWAYCVDHLYGGKIVGGHIEVSVAADSPAALRR